MFNDLIRKYLFKCEDCQAILSVEFEDPEDFKKIQEDKIELQCPCGGCSKVLRD